MCQEQHEHEAASEVHQVARIDQSPNEAFVVLHVGYVRDDVTRSSIAEEAAQSGDQPDREQHAEADEGGDDLVFRDRRGEQSDGQKQGSQQYHAEIPGPDGIPVKVAEEHQDCRDQCGESDQPKIDHKHADKLADDDICDPQRRGQQKLEGSQLALFREQPHGQYGQDNHKDDSHAREEISKDQVVQVDLRRPALHLHQLDGLRARESDVQVGQQSENQQKDRSDHIDNGRDEIDAQFLANDGLYRGHTAFTREGAMLTVVSVASAE